MFYSWHEEKREKNITKHGLDFIDAPVVFGGPLLSAAGKTVGGEKRCQVTGLLDDVHVTIIYALRGDTRRIISMRRARHEEKAAYQDIFNG